MMKRENIEAVLTEMARLQGHELKAQERLLIRTRLNSALSAKDKYRQRMNSPEYRWKKPSNPLR